MSVPMPRYGSFTPPPRPSHSTRPINAPSNAGLVLGLLAALVLLLCASWLASHPVAAAVSTQQIATSPGLPPPPSTEGSTVPFDGVWTFSTGNSIVASEPTVGPSDSTSHPHAPVIRIAVTLTNNSDQEWSPVFTTFDGTLNGTSLLESSESDWSYSNPIVPHSSVTLSKAFLGSPGQFALTVHAPDGVATFTGQV